MYRIVIDAENQRVYRFNEETGQTWVLDDIDTDETVDKSYGAVTLAWTEVPARPAPKVFGVPTATVTRVQG